MSSGIYQIRNLQNGHLYVGSAADLSKRKYDHFYKLERGNHTNAHLQAAYYRYGSDSFVFEILEHCDKASLVGREQDYINSLNPAYNIRLIAHSNLGLRHTDDARRKIGDASRGKPFSGIPNRVITEEMKAKISASQKGRKFTDEHRRKLSEARRRNLGK